MGTGWRQWKALTRKNSINWRRKIKCSILELLCPIIAMGFMVLLRWKVHASSGSQNSLFLQKTPTFLPLSYSHRKDSWSFLTSLATTNRDLTDFFEYASYPWGGMYKNESNYSMLEDIRGPLYFLPSDCVKARSFAFPK